MDVNGIGLVPAFFAGAVSFLSPCVLPLVPAYVSFIAGESLDRLTGDEARERRAAVLLPSALFVLGFSTVFVLLGASATAIGDLLFRHRGTLETVAGAIVVLFGLAMTGLLRLPVLQRDLRFHPGLPGGRPAAAYVLGAAFGFGWTPCIGPILGGVLALAAVGDTVSGGMVLLAVYSLGLGVPFLLAAGFTGFFLRNMRGLGRFGRGLQTVAGLVLVAMGLAMLTGHLSGFAFWLLETFPFLNETVR